MREIVFGISGSVYLAFAVLALFGLQQPLRFAPIRLTILILLTKSYVIGLAVVAYYAAFLADIWVPETVLYYLPITPTTSRWDIWPEAEKANQFIREYPALHLGK